MRSILYCNALGGGLLPGYRCENHKIEHRKQGISISEKTKQPWLMSISGCSNRKAANGSGTWLNGLGIGYSGHNTDTGSRSWFHLLRLLGPIFLAILIRSLLRIAGLIYFEPSPSKSGFIVFFLSCRLRSCAKKGLHSGWHIRRVSLCISFTWDVKES